MSYKYTEKEVKTLIDNMVVVIDKREQSNKHIKDYLDKKKIKYIDKSMDTGDYSFYIQANEETVPLGIMRDLWFDNKIVIERKADLEELSNNLTTDRTRIVNEFIRGASKRFYLALESGSYSEVILHGYNTKFNPKAFLASLNAMQERYNIFVEFVGDKSAMGCYIYHKFVSFLKEYYKAIE